jgi:hypothetical protein
VVERGAEVNVLRVAVASVVSLAAFLGLLAWVTYDEADLDHWETYRQVLLVFVWVMGFSLIVGCVIVLWMWAV